RICRRSARRAPALPACMPANRDSSREPILADLARWTGRFRTSSNGVRERPTLTVERAYVATMMKLTMVVAMLAGSLQLAAQTKYQVVTLPDLGASGQANSIIN